MSDTAFHDNIRAMMRRFAGHLESGDHVLRGVSQYEIAHDSVAFSREIDPETKRPHTNGYIVAPGGIGKTISAGDLIVGINTMPNGRYVLGHPALGKRVLVTAPTNQLVDQWADRLLGEWDEAFQMRKPSIFGDRFTEDNVGVYHADLTDREKQDVLSKAVVIIVHDSARILHAYVDPKTGENISLLRPEEFDLVLIDEVDDKVRGDVNSRFYRDEIFPRCFVIGLTATHLFRSGKTIGDYLFGGKKPICEITHFEGVQRREIAPHINVVVEPEIDPSSIIQPLNAGWDDYSEAQQMNFIKQTGLDNALLEVIKVGRHPVTGKAFRDMMQMHQAVNIEHAKFLAARLNETFGAGYAEAVWGGEDESMDEFTQRLTKWMLEHGDIKAVVQCKLWGRGTDIPGLEMTVQHAPSLSPNKTTQFHTRASRLKGDIPAIYLSPFIPGIDQLVIGELLGGMRMLPDGYEFPPTEGKHNDPSDPFPWPVIEGVKVHYTQRQLEMFAAEQHHRRYVNGLPVKNRHMLILEETAQALGIAPDILRARVFAPLQEAFEKKQAREKFVDLQSREADDFLHVRGKMFPAWRVGFCQHKSKEAFYVERDLVSLCEHALYGRLDNAPPEMLERAAAKNAIGCDDAQIKKLSQKLQEAFFQRAPYQRETSIDGVPFTYDSFGFYRNAKGGSEFFLHPDALVPAYRRIHRADAETASQWADKPAIRQYKTSLWLTEADVMSALDLNPILGGAEAKIVHGLFDNIRSQTRSLHTGYEETIILGKGANRRSVQVAKCWLPLAGDSGQIAHCIRANALEWIKGQLGMESAFDSKGKGCENTRPGADPHPTP